MLGRLIGGRYEVIRHIAGGGMATVYQGKDTILDRVVAIKVMDQQLGKDDEFIERFLLEAKATGRLSHPNIVSVYDVGEENGIYYMVMEFIEGVTLKDYIMDKGYLSAEEAVEICSQICDGLAHAHSQGIIHRDIKPHNILCTADGRYKITDFGIARFVEVASHLTKTGTVMGSVHYFSPEQASGQPISFPSDIYSLGVVLFEMITGSVPFDAKEHVQVAIMHLHDEVPDLTLVQDDLPPTLAKVILKALAKKPEDRYASADQFKQALVRSLHATEPIRQESRSQIVEPRMIPEKKSKSKLIVAIGVVLVLIVSYLFWTMGNPTKADTPPPTSVKKQVARNTPQNNVQTTYVVVAGSYKVHSSAQKLLKKIIKQNFEARIIRKEVNGQIIYRVYSGTFTDKDSAEQHLQEMQQSGIDGLGGAYISTVN